MLPWLFITAALGQSDLGLFGVVLTVVGFLGLALALVASIRKPSWPLLWLVLPPVVPHVFLQVVGVWLIGDHHETVSLSLYAAALLATLVIAVYAARANPLAVAGAVVFALTYAWIAFVASVFVFWNGLH
jgi:hypothetical membrane protein